MSIRMMGLATLLAAASLAACGLTPEVDRNLTRGEAARQLRLRPELFSVESWKLRVERVCVMMEAGFDDGASLALLRQAQQFERAGYATVREMAPQDFGSDLEFFRAGRSCPWGAGKWMSVKLTDKGTQAAKTWQRRGDTYSLAVARPALEVTGIQQGPYLQLVEYTLEFQPTAEGKKLGYAGRRLQGNALFQRYDDGTWRLTRDGADQLKLASR